MLFDHGMRIEFCMGHIFIMATMFSDTDLYIICNLHHSWQTASY